MLADVSYCISVVKKKASMHARYGPLSHGSHVESQENRKLWFYTASLDLNSRLAEAWRAKTQLIFPRDSAE